MQLKHFVLGIFVTTTSMVGAGQSLPALVSHALALLTDKKLTIRDYRIAKCELNAAAYAAQRMIHMGGKQAAHFAFLESDALAQAESWKNTSNPLWSLDLYNPVHLVAVVAATYTACRCVEWCVRRVCQKIQEKLKGTRHET